MLQEYSHGIMSHRKDKQRLDAAFEFITKIGVEYYCFHDVDVVGNDGTVFDIEKRLQDNPHTRKMQEDHNVKLCGGTANHFLIRVI